MHGCVSICVHTDGPKYGSKSAQVAQMRGEKAFQYAAPSATQPSTLPDCCELVTRRGTCARPLAARPVLRTYLTGSQKGLRAACGATCVSPHCKMPHKSGIDAHRRTNYDLQMRGREVRLVRRVLGVLGKPCWSRGYATLKRACSIRSARSTWCPAAQTLAQCVQAPAGRGQREQRQ